MTKLNRIWSTNRPTVRGHYWVLIPSMGLRIVKVHSGSPWKSEAFGSDADYGLKVPTGPLRWYGPIQPPRGCPR